MKVPRVCLVLLTAAAGVYGLAAGSKDEVHPVTVDSVGDEVILTPQNNYQGWVNPEDLAPIPQCIAQQDETAWLNAMTNCTGKLCIRHFGFICTHHQWLTQLSCLNMELSPDVLTEYLPQCSRSVLAKAQLYRWISNVTGRTWLVDVGDANGLRNLSPASLTEGYASVGVTAYAPKCLTESTSVAASPREPFPHVMETCGFTSTTQHTGNVARPWEYNEQLRSIIALDSETVGYYDLIGQRMRSPVYGNYFDKECFCGAFSLDPQKEPCQAAGNLDLTKERLWMKATCGTKSLPANWTDGLKTTGFAYIPTGKWHLPTFVPEILRPLTELTEQCTTDACKVGSNGYCKGVSAVDRACFCREMSYESCGSSCQSFETRIDYVNWLHGLCGEVPNWHGLPDNWRQLAAPTAFDMIPWRWTVKPSCDGFKHYPQEGVDKIMEQCASTGFKLGSFAWISKVMLIVTCIRWVYNKGRITWLFHPWQWFRSGIQVAFILLLLTLFNALFNAGEVQNEPGYGDVPFIQLVLLWSSMPRFTWMQIWLVGIHPLLNPSATASYLVAEIVLQVMSSYFMIKTVDYGREHNFYLGAMERLDGSTPAKLMYAGALLWSFVMIVAVVLLLQAISRWWHITQTATSTQTRWEYVQELMATCKDFCTWLEEHSAPHWMDKDPIEDTWLGCSKPGEVPNYLRDYGTFSGKGQDNQAIYDEYVRPYATPVAGILLLLWIAQWLFWIGLAGIEYCPPDLGLLTYVSVFPTIVFATLWAFR